MTPQGRASPARVCALRTLRRVADDDAYADRAFRAEADRAGLDARERAFAQRLAYGAIQRRATIDHVLSGISARPLAEIDPPLLDALRLGVYQLVWLGSVPDRAAVDETVELAKLAAPSAAGFANAVMRRAGREARGLVASLDDSTPERAALAHSHPEWLARAWWEELGPADARALMAADNEAAESAVRANELRTTAGELRAALAEQEVTARTAPELPEALVLDAPFDAHGSELFARGLLMPQSRGSMLVSRVLAPRPGERVLDMCAAPGAKTTHLAALMKNEGELVAVERDPGRARELRENCERMGATCVEVRQADATAAPPGRPFERILLDAPCSDLGTLRSRPDARWRKSPEQVERVAREQAALLDAAAAGLAPGGTLVYSTCTISPPENARQVERLLAAEPSLRADDLGAEHPEFHGAGDPRFLQLLPHRDGTDGFFIARIRRV